MSDGAVNRDDAEAREGAGAPDPPASTAPPEPPGPAPEAATFEAATPAAAQAGPSVDAAAQLRAQLSGLGIVNPLPAVVASLLSYAAALVSAAIVVVIMVLGLALAGSGSAVGELGADVLGTDVALSGIGAALRMPFQLVALAAFGSYGLDVAVPFAGEMTLSLRFMPLLVTAVFLGAAYIGGRFVGRRQPGTGPLGIATSAAVGGVVAGLLVVLAARLMAQPIPVEGMTLGVHAAGIDAFLGAMVLGGVALSFTGAPAPRGGRS